MRIGGLLVTNEWLALAIFLAAAGTDLLDGFLARRWGQITTIGTLLDPIADKLLVSAALISLVQVHAVPAWMVVMIIGREFAVSGLARHRSGRRLHNPRQRARQDEDDRAGGGDFFAIDFSIRHLTSSAPPIG